MKPLILAALLLTPGCTEAPTPAEAEKAAKANAEIDSQSEVRAEKKSIEQAADAAAKLVEEEANAEIEALQKGE